MIYLHLKNKKIIIGRRSARHRKGALKRKAKQSGLARNKKSIEKMRRSSKKNRK